MLNVERPGGQQPNGFPEPSATYSFSMVAWWRSCSSRNWFWRFHFVLKWQESQDNHRLNFHWRVVLLRRSYLLFWYQVFTWVSDRFKVSATSLRSATLKYFWQRNFLSKYANWACVKAVRRRLGFRPLFSKFILGSLRKFECEGVCECPLDGGSVSFWYCDESKLDSLLLRLKLPFDMELPPAPL